MHQIKTAMILAAGRGTRMKHLTDNCPKPLIQVCSDTLLSHLIKKIETYGIHDIVINTCYKADMIKEETKKHIKSCFVFSDEDVALETGGGVKKALPLLIERGGSDGFFALNADPLWDEPTKGILEQLSNSWNPNTMDILLAFVPIQKAFGDVTDGNYFIENGKPRRKHKDETNVPYLFMGVQILHPRIFEKELPEIFSLRDLYDEAQKNERLSYVIFDGNWYHVGTPEAIEETNHLFFKQGIK
jgi:MurNAc alpha-1-phosphate uridylyltransferase